MRIQNLVAKMDVAYLSFGCVILTMIAVMILMNQLICVVNVTVLLAGNVAPDNRITVAYPNGCSVMAKMIAVTTVMNCQRIVQNVQQKLTSNVAITVAYLSELNILCQRFKN